MPSERHQPEKFIGELHKVQIVLARGATTAEACRRIVVSEQVFIAGKESGLRFRFAPLPSGYRGD